MGSSPCGGSDDGCLSKMGAEEERAGWRKRRGDEVVRREFAEELCARPPADAPGRGKG